MKNRSGNYKIKLAIIGDRGIPARYSGFSTLVEQLAVRLAQDYNMEVTVYCRSPYYSEKPSSYKGVQCVYLPAPGGKSFESIIHSNLSIYHGMTRPYDLIFIVDPGNAPFSWPFRLKGVPTVFHTDGLGWKRQKWSPLQQRYYKWTEWVCSRLASWLVTDSRAMQDYYFEEYGVTSSYIPYSGEVGNPPSSTALEKFGLQKEHYYLVVARVEPENNIDLIILEYRRAKIDRPLVVVGGARHETPYSRSISEESDNKVLCLGSIFESEILNGLYQNCYAYLHGHEVGGTNPSLLRAMHAGAACVAINVVFHREVMSEEGVFFEKEPGHLATILRRLESDSECIDSLGCLAWERSQKLYQWDAVAAGYAELFKKVLLARKKKISIENLLRDEIYRPWEFQKSKRIQVPDKNNEISSEEGIK